MQKREDLGRRARTAEIEPRTRGILRQADTHRGVCPGSVQYRFQPREEAEDYEVMKLVDAAYRDMKLELDFSTDEGCRTFFLVFMEACKALVQRGKRVKLAAGRLVFEARVYKDGSDSYLLPLATERTFNRLSTPIELDKTLQFLGKKRKAAQRSPFDKVFDGEKQPQTTFVTCPECGAKIKIAEGQAA